MNSTRDKLCFDLGAYRAKLHRITFRRSETDLALVDAAGWCV
jgi:hypothetical protein